MPGAARHTHGIMLAARMRVANSPWLHHVVLAVAPDRLPITARLFTDLGFRFEAFDLDDLGLHVMPDWSRGLELVTPTEAGTANPVQRFLDRHGDGWQLDEIELTVLGLPLTLSATDLP